MRRYLTISATVLAAALAITAAATYASATTTDTLTYGSKGGTNVAVGSVLTTTLQSGTNATFYTTTDGTTGGVCSSGALSATVQSNPPAGGVADTSTTSQTFTNCTNNLNISSMSVSISTPYAATSSVYGIGINTINSTITGWMGTWVKHFITCYYTGTNISGTTTFTNQLLSLSSGSSSSVMYFSAAYNQFVDTSVSGNPIVYVN